MNLMDWMNFALAQTQILSLWVREDNADSVTARLYTEVFRNLTSPPLSFCPTS